MTSPAGIFYSLIYHQYTALKESVRSHPPQQPGIGCNDAVGAFSALLTILATAIVRRYGEIMLVDQFYENAALNSNGYNVHPANQLFPHIISPFREGYITMAAVSFSGFV